MLRPHEAPARVNMLSQPMRRAVTRLAAAPLYQQRHGYSEAENGLDGIGATVINGLVSRQLVTLTFQPLKGKMVRCCKLNERGRWYARTLATMAAAGALPSEARQSRYYVAAE